MTIYDWIVLMGTLFFIVGYGIWKTRGSKNIEGYLKGDNTMKWWTIGFSIMATQASAITFLSTPGQAYEEGMGFVQFYFGLPIAMVIIAAFFVPYYFRLKVYTAYEFLESRFDLKTRQLIASLFLVQRGLAAGITIYAPAIILSSILGWSLNFTSLFIGVTVIIYTVSGGTKAVSQTHKWQLGVMMGGMIIALIMILNYLPESLSIGDAIKVAGKMGKMNIVDTGFDASQKYNLWSGLIGGLFLALSYFGTDQSQVGRYLGGKSIKEIRTGLMFNGLLKIPMQFFILFVGVMVFVFYLFNAPPIMFDQNELAKIEESQYKHQLDSLQVAYDQNFEIKRQKVYEYLEAERRSDQEGIDAASSAMRQYETNDRAIREEVKNMVRQLGGNDEDDDYIFIGFVMKYLPIGLVGLLLAVIFSAAMSSTSAELNALGSTTVIDFYKRSWKKKASEKHYLLSSRVITLIFGLLAMLFAITAQLFENLIEYVNMLGSIFYGTILGVFLTAFFFRFIKARAVFIAAIISQLMILALFIMNYLEVINIGYLWYNIIAPAIVIGMGFLLQWLLGNEPPSGQPITAINEENK